MAITGCKPVKHERVIKAYAIIRDMKSGSKALGFTIVETLIFLAVSSVLLVSALALVNGAQHRTEFTQAINDLDQQINNVFNDVANGYYPNSSNFTCTKTGANVQIATSAGPVPQGTNTDCVFLGKVTHFTSGDNFLVFSVAGLRQFSGPPVREVRTLVEADPTAISFTDTVPTIPDVTNVQPYKNGIRVFRVKDPATNLRYASIGIFTTLADYNGSVIRSGGTSLQIVPINTSVLSDNQGRAARIINTQAGTSSVADGVVVCIDSGSTNQHAVLTIGGRGRKTNTTLDIRDGNSALDLASCS